MTGGPAAAMLDWTTRRQTATTEEPDVEANAFLDYLKAATRTAELADALAEILTLRRTVAVRRLVPIPVEANTNFRVAV